jgi:hypothetical protein
VSQQSVTLTGSVNPRGAATTYFFQIGTTSLYGFNTAVAPAGNGSRRVAVTALVGALAPATRYHYRLVARNRHGLVTGGDRSFKTKPQPLGVSLAATPNPVPFGGSTTLAGTLSGTGNVGRQVVLQANPFPYTQGFVTVGNAQVTNALGGFAFPILSIPANTQYRVAMPQKPTVVSPIVFVGVAVRVSTHVKVHKARRGHKRGRARFFGRLVPARPGTQIVIQKLRRGQWASVAQTFARPAGAAFSRYSKRVRLRHGGRFRVVAVVSGNYVSNAGRTVHFRVH